MTSYAFWSLATLQVALSIGLVLRLRFVPHAELSARHFALAAGQRKDSWLACALIWTVIAGRGTSVDDAIYVAGAAMLVWLMQRTLQRLHTLRAFRHLRD